MNFFRKYFSVSEMNMKTPNLEGTEMFEKGMKRIHKEFKKLAFFHIIWGYEEKIFPDNTVRIKFRYPAFAFKMILKAIAGKGGKSTEQ